MKKYTVQHEKTMQFCSIEIYTHIPRKLQTYIHKHTEKCYTMIYTPIIYPNTKLNCLTCRNPWVPVHKERVSAPFQQL